MKVSLRQQVAAARRLAALALCLLAATSAARAQSPDANSPTPVTGPEITGRIVPLDLGDSRLTRHFYAFGAQQGDLELTVDSSNLEGDIDIFAAAGLRPLAKVTLFSGLNSGVSRTVYLRRPEALVLRVQARSPNDSEGTYRIRLAGAFVAAAAPAATETNAATERARNEAVTARGAGGSARRVSSTGARIEQPREEVAAESAPPAEPAPTPTEAAPPARTNTARRGAARTRPDATTRPETARRGTTRGASRTPTRTARPGSGEGAGAASGGDGSATTSNTVRPATSSGGAPARPAARAGRNSRANRTRNESAARRGETAARGGEGTTAEPATPADSSAAAEPARAAVTGLELPGTRLVLELREGGLFVRAMSDVRRVAVERGFVVVTLKTGRVERQPLSNVLRMTIEP